MGKGTLLVTVEAVVNGPDSAAYIDVPAFMNLRPAALIVAEGTKIKP